MSSMPLQSAIYDVLLCQFIYLCFFCMFYAFTSQISPHGRFLQGRAKEKKPIYHIPKTSPRSRGIRILYAFFVCFTFYCGMIFSLWSLFNACLLCELDWLHTSRVSRLRGFGGRAGGSGFGDSDGFGETTIVANAFRDVWKLESTNLFIV
jgi:hypothetical protein